MIPLTRVVVQVAGVYNPERTDGRERPNFRAAERVILVAHADMIALRGAWKVQVLRQDVTNVRNLAVAVTIRSIASVVRRRVFLRSISVADAIELRLERAESGHGCRRCKVRAEFSPRLQPAHPLRRSDAPEERRSKRPPRATLTRQERVSDVHAAARRGIRIAFSTRLRTSTRLRPDYLAS